MEEFLEEFGLSMEEDKPAQEEDEIFHIFLFKTNEKIFSIFRLCLEFFGEGFSIPETLFLRLLDEAKLRVFENTAKFALIRNGFIEAYEGKEWPHQE